MFIYYLWLWDFCERHGEWLQWKANSIDYSEWKWKSRLHAQQTDRPTSLLVLLIWTTAQCLPASVMLWIILWSLLGYTLLLLFSWAPGFWLEADASFELALPYLTMPPLYSTSHFHNLNNNHQHPKWLDILKEVGILHQDHPPHRGSGHMFISCATSPNSIPSLWSCRTPTSSLCHYSKPYTNPANLHCLPQLIQSKLIQDKATSPENGLAYHSLP